MSLLLLGELDALVYVYVLVDSIFQLTDLFFKRGITITPFPI
jgi:hypothetical protein